jgi:hypothetical protein
VHSAPDTYDAVPCADAYALHGVDAASFLIGGGKWYTSEAACEAGKLHTRPVFLRCEAMAQRMAGAAGATGATGATGAAKPEPLSALEEAFATERRTTFFRASREGAGCEPVSVEHALRPRVAVGFWTARPRGWLYSGAETLEYELFDEPRHALWIATPTATDPTHGEVLDVASEEGALRVGEQRWYSAEAACLQASSGRH